MRGKKIKNKRGIMEQMKKRIEGVVTWIYSAVLLMELQIKIKKNIVLNYIVGNLNFAPSFLITLYIFRSLLVIPSANTRGQRCIQCLTLWNSHRLSMILSVIVTCRHNIDRLESIRKVVSDGCGISYNAILKCQRNRIRPQSHQLWLWHFQ